MTSKVTILRLDGHSFDAPAFHRTSCYAKDLDRISGALSANVGIGTQLQEFVTTCQQTLKNRKDRHVGLGIMGHSAISIVTPMAMSRMCVSWRRNGTSYELAPIRMTGSYMQMCLRHLLIQYSRTLTQNAHDDARSESNKEKDIVSASHCGIHCPICQTKQHVSETEKRTQVEGVHTDIAYQGTETVVTMLQHLLLALEIEHSAVPILVIVDFQHHNYNPLLSECSCKVLSRPIVYMLGGEFWHGDDKTMLEDLAKAGIQPDLRIYLGAEADTNVQVAMILMNMSIATHATMVRDIENYEQGQRTVQHPLHASASRSENRPSCVVGYGLPPADVIVNMHPIALYDDLPDGQEVHSFEQTPSGTQTPENW